MDFAPLRRTEETGRRAGQALREDPVRGMSAIAEAAVREDFARRRPRAIRWEPSARAALCGPIARRVQTAVECARPEIAADLLRAAIIVRQAEECVRRQADPALLWGEICLRDGEPRRREGE